MKYSEIALNVGECGVMHSVSVRGGFKKILFAGHNPKGPMGGRCGNVVAGRQTELTTSNADVALLISDIFDKIGIANENITILVKFGLVKNQPFAAYQLLTD